jgi:hypothetical protein
MPPRSTIFAQLRDRSSQIRKLVDAVNTHFLLLLCNRSNHLT